jgi:predicted AAA+ superfamily ATPase
VVEQIAKLPQRFVLFCDDLSFESGEGDYRVLKSVLDGSLEQAPDNVLLYATSNRRHLVPEKESDNENWKRVDGELHPSEAVEDKIALSDRFGLWLSFYPFTQEHFLDVVEHWIGQLADKAGLAWQRSEELDILAVRWATGRGNRNGRCAYQFARYWVGLKLLEHKACSIYKTAARASRATACCTRSWNPCWRTSATSLPTPRSSRRSCSISSRA